MAESPEHNVQASNTQESNNEPDRVVELRIHGVHGGAAVELLDTDPTKHVAGDDLSGFVRPRMPHDHETVPGVRREAFVWGNLTSGQATRALWLLLLPFMLVNMAYWMRPRRLGPGASRRHLTVNYGYDVLVRLLALSLTALLTLAAAGIGMDLVGWQCSGYGAACAELRPWLGLLSAPDSPLSAPGVALVVGAALPIAVIFVLARLSRRTGVRYEAVFDGEEYRAREGEPANTSTDSTPTSDTPDPTSTVEDTTTPIARRSAPLSHPHFWHGARLFGQLRSVHIAVAYCVVTALLVLPPLLYDRGVAPERAAVGMILLGVVILVAALAGIVSCLHTALPREGRVLRWLGIASVPLGAGYAALWPRPGWAAEGALPGFGTSVTVVLAVQCVLAVVLFAVAFVLYRGSGQRSLPLYGLAGPAVAAIGIHLGGVFGAALGYQSAEWLGGCLYPGAEDAGCLAFHSPTPYSWLQLAFTLEAVILLVALLALWGTLVRRARNEDDPAPEYGQARGAWPARSKAIRWARATASLTDAAPKVLFAILLPAIALALLIGYMILTGRFTPLRPNPETALSPQRLVSDLSIWVLDPATVLVTIGSFLGALFLASLLWLGRSAYRDQPTREAVGVLWDIGTFWPRAAHPLAPPSYAERAVPQLVGRVCKLTATDGAGVVLSGHSQGSVLAAATVWQLPAGYARRVALLTHGSPLDRLYARFFPAYFGPVALTELNKRVSGRWWNLWRRTDPIACAITLTDGRIVPSPAPMPDPSRFDRPEGEALPLPLMWHSWYTRETEYTTVLTSLAGTVHADTVSDSPVADAPRAPAPRTAPATPVGVAEPHQPP